MRCDKFKEVQAALAHCVWVCRRSVRAEGTAFLMSTWEDTKTFVYKEPPDSRHMLDMVGWYVLLTILIRGPELSEDLRELSVRTWVVPAFVAGELTVDE